MKNTIEELKKNKVVAVVRAKDKSEAIKIVEACLKGGIKAIEVTFTIPKADEVIAEINKIFGDKILLGAGTVIDKEKAVAAIGAGAKYIVSPGFDLETAKYLVEIGMPYLPGCMTITEMLTARNHGAKIIKLFPGSAFGPSFIKSVKGPLPDMEIMPTGGVNLNNIKEWFDNGVCAVGIGSALTKYAASNEFDKMTEVAKQYIEAARSV
jgi:2-dehydro-3-deoxyphosphogluconate aldolase/(4S)-4-hydroxy-2-oxoglutarate aldolase